MVSICVVCVHQHTMCVVCVHQHAMSVVCVHEYAMCVVCIHQHAMYVVCIHQHAMCVVCIRQHAMCVVCVHSMQCLWSVYTACNVCALCTPAAYNLYGLCTSPYNLYGLCTPAYNLYGLCTPAYNLCGLCTPAYNLYGLCTPAYNLYGLCTPACNVCGLCTQYAMSVVCVHSMQCVCSVYTCSSLIVSGPQSRCAGVSGLQRKGEEACRLHLSRPGHQSGKYTPVLHTCHSLGISQVNIPQFSTPVTAWASIR